MKIRYNVFRIYSHREYDSEEVIRFIKIIDHLTIDGFKSESEAENWILENGTKNLDYIVLKTIKPTN